MADIFGKSRSPEPLYTENPDSFPEGVLIATQSAVLFRRASLPSAAAEKPTLPTAA